MVRRRHQHHTFRNEAVKLDGRDFSHCEFENCVIVLERGDTSLEACTFRNCKLVLQGNAYNVARIITAVIGNRPLKVLEVEGPWLLKRPSEEG